MFNRATSFRKSSRAIMLAGVAGLFVGASGMATGPAQADDTNNKYIAACAHLKNGTDAHAGCLITQIDRKTADLKKQQQEARDAAPCITFLLGKLGKETTTEELRKIAGGDITNANACMVKEKRFGNKAELPGPPSTLKPTPAAFTAD